MPHTLRTGTAECQSAPADRIKGERDQWLTLVRRAVAETGWTCDALDAEWRLSRGYSWRLLNGEKPWSVDRMLALPDDIEARLVQLHLEQKFGGTVVPKMTDAEVLVQLHRAAATLLVRANLVPRPAPLKADLPPAVSAERAL
jgi:hypothetical protein